MKPNLCPSLTSGNLIPPLANNQLLYCRAFELLGAIYKYYLSTDGSDDTSRWSLITRFGGKEPFPYM